MKKVKNLFLIFLLTFALTGTTRTPYIEKLDTFSNANESFANYNELYGIEQTIEPNLSRKENTQTKILKYLAVFIEFEGNDSLESHLDDEESVANAQKLLNSDELFDMDTVNGLIKVPSFKKYYEMQSYGKLSITTEIFPREDGKVASYKDPHPVEYYMPYSSTNTIGYKDKTESVNRETELIDNAIAAVSANIEASGIKDNEIDTDNDGFVDAISFFIEGQGVLESQIKWGDLLWSHKLDNYALNSTILGKKVVPYNLIYTYDYRETAGIFSLNRGTYGTIMHEFGHTLGLVDLYRFDHSDSLPVGFYDLMGKSSGSNPANFLAYFTSEYSDILAWHTPLPVVSKSTENITLYKPKFEQDDEKRAIKIQLDSSSKEYFIVEYHSKQNTYTSYSADQSGIIVYRVNDNNKYSGDKEGGDHGELDHIFIFRPEEPALGAGRGKLSQATLNTKRPTLGKETATTDANFDNETIYYSNGTNSGIQIVVTGETEDSITFDVSIPSLRGSGTQNDPYDIYSREEFISFLRSGTNNKYYRLMADLDFENIIYPEIDFQGNLDGNGKTLKNITSSTGVFDDLGDYKNSTTIKNLFVENVQVTSTKGSYLGGFASTTTNVIIDNVHLLSGSVTNSESALNNPLDSTGGFVGNASKDTTIVNCSSHLSVEAPKNVGGFIGLNMNAIIEDSFTTGEVKGNERVGRFIAQQCIMDNFYHTPQNAYYSNLDDLPAVGGYAEYMHDQTALSPDNLDTGINGIYVSDKAFIKINETLTLEPVVTPSKNIIYTTTSSDETLAQTSSNVLLGLQRGTLDIYTDVKVGTNAMRFTTRLSVLAEEGEVEEQDVLDYLGLTKKTEYILGFTIGDKVENVIAHLESFPGVTLQNFKNSQREDIASGIIATGMTFALEISSTTYEYTVVIKGDANGDGLIYATDYVKVKNQIMGRPTLDGAYFIAADIDGDGNIYATDYVKIKNYIMGRGEIPQK